MRPKKLLFFAALLVMLVIGLVVTGTAVAAPSQPAHHETVTGSLADVVFVPSEPPVADPHGTTWHEAGTWMGAFAGDLHGTFTEDSTLHGRGSTPGDWDGRFTYDGTGTFIGTLDEAPITFTYKVRGRGYNGFDAPAASLGPYLKIKSTFTITGSTGAFAHLKGTIHIYTFVDSSFEGGTTYKGNLAW